MNATSAATYHHDQHPSSYLPSVAISANVISTIGFGISILLLSTHLIVYSITRDMRTLTGNSLASFCLSLLLSYCAYIGGMVVHDAGSSSSASYGSSPCLIVALCAFYFFSANSSWLLSISLQLYNNVVAASRHRLDHDRRNAACRFARYSAFSWLQPALFLGVALYAQTRHLFGGMPKNLRVDLFPLGTGCFNNNTSVLIWFLVLFNVNLTVTFALSALTAFVAGRKSKRPRQRAVAAVQDDVDDDDVFQSESDDQLFTQLRYYMRLSLVVGFVWIVGMAMIYFKAHLLQIVFAVSNVALALYIFLVFTFNNKLSSVVFSDQRKSYDMDTIAVRHAGKPLDDDQRHQRHPQNATAAANTMSDV